ncbi:hypothetical protein MLD38_035953 [Melastoma candidum]|uniref:Uncharacterized protein n=1 Tax=Melastoma candidum TaxID=119954 RepID=A0ACB9LIC9_9MYRT|nr:hypothetical protein MLD38_035953 [Melastoma candidum]
MGSMGGIALAAVTFLCAVLLFDQAVPCHRVSAARPLKTDHDRDRILPLMTIMDGDVVLAESLSRGTVPPSRSSPCTHIPGVSRGRCTLDVANISGGGSSRVPPNSAASADQVVGRIGSTS